MQQPHNAYFMDLWLRIGLLNKQIASELPQCSLFALLDIARRVNGEVWGTRSASKPSTIVAGHYCVCNFHRQFINTPHRCDTFRFQNYLSCQRRQRAPCILLLFFHCIYHELEMNATTHHSTFNSKFPKQKHLSIHCL